MLPVGPLEADPDDREHQTMCDSATVIREITFDRIDWSFMGHLGPVLEKKFSDAMTYADLQVIIKQLTEVGL